MNTLTLCCIKFIILGLFGKCVKCEERPNFLIWGPGLQPNIVITPARYFFIEAVDENQKRVNIPSDSIKVSITGESEYGNCRIWINKLDRKDGSFIIRYKLYYPCHNLQIEVKFNRQHIGESPYVIPDRVYNEECYCPNGSVEEFLSNYGCKLPYKQIQSDLKPFKNVDMNYVRNIVQKKFNSPGSYSICNYVIKDNEIYRKCYGQHVGFKMFIDAILLSLARKILLPDTEFWTNLGDWPLIKVSDGHLPMFSWCGSNDTYDIVMPTYDITESTLENMGRVMLDLLSVQGNIEKSWEEKVPQAFWRGRDSSRERLSLLEISQKYPDLINASITNYFFFREQEKIYGKSPHISFFKFFNYKYQINIDGSVAAYRFPYLLIGDSVVLKQDSQYYEHFYNMLEPNKHYIPVRRDLSDLVEKLKWAIKNDNIAKNISLEGNKWARENLMPTDVFCYHVSLLNEWSKKVTSDVIILDDMEHVPQPAPDKHYGKCKCLKNIKDEL